MQVPQPPELIHLIIPLILLPPPNAESLNELGKVENADPTAIMSVQFDPDGKTIVSGGYSGTLKVWDAAAAADKRRPAERPAETSEVLEAIYPPSPLLSASYPPPSSPTSA